jgi:hypothetical protein
MAKHGFVYILGNVAMPGRYKVGHTFNSPFQRAEDLSRATGVPVEFTVLGFAAFQDPESYERAIHARFAASRCPRREFFQCPLRVLWNALVEDENRSVAVDVEIDPWCHEEERQERHGTLRAVWNA